MRFNGLGKVLAVDDEPAVLALERVCLEPEGWDLRFARTGREALAEIDRDPPDVVLVDLGMPGMTGADLIRRIRRSPEGRRIALIVVSGSMDHEFRVEAFRAGATEMVDKPFHPGELRERVRTALRQKEEVDGLEDGARVLMAMARAVEARDATTGHHCDRLKIYAGAFARTLGLGAAETETLRRGAVLHDIGKIGVPDAILLAPRRLTPEETAVMRRHPELGEAIARPLRTLADVLPIIRHHHERWDGSGYPDGLRGEEIPRPARVFQILDVFDALTARRPYKPAMPVEDAMAVLKAEEAKGWYEPGLADAWGWTLIRERDRDLVKSAAPCEDELCTVGAV